MGFLIVPNLVSLLIFRAWFVTDQFCHVTFHFNNDTGGIKEREDDVMGGGGGDNSREVNRLGLGLGVRVPHNQQNILKHLTNET